MSQGYDNPDIFTYSFGVYDFGNASEALAIKGPSGKKGTLLDIGVAVTETFTATTTPAYVRLGTATDADAYAELNMGTAADTNYYNTLDDTDAIIDGNLPADTQVEVAFVAPTGGTPAGQGYVNIVVAWY